MGAFSTGQPEIVVDTEAERDLGWPIYTEVFCLDTGKSYMNNGIAWVQKSTSTGSGGTGTVTSASVTTANGVSGSVAMATTTPAITLTLGAITPTTIIASSTIAGSNLSGTNTGDSAVNTSSMFIGTTSHTLNRASAGETLAGITLTTPVIGAATGTSLAVTGAVTSSGAGIGYATGAGGTVSQATSRATGVTLSKLCGNITMFSAAVLTQASSSFVLTNTLIAATDTVIVYHISATNGGAWNFSVVPAAGSCTIIVRNITAASITEATPLRFAVIKAVTA